MSSAAHSNSPFGVGEIVRCSSSHLRSRRNPSPAVAHRHLEGLSGSLLVEQKACHFDAFGRGGVALPLLLRVSASFPISPMQVLVKRQSLILNSESVILFSTTKSIQIRE